MKHPNHIFRLIVFFDGMCVLCNRTVRFLIKYDKQKLIAVSSNESVYAQMLFKDKSIDIKKLDSIVVYDIESSIVYIKSGAVLKILRQMKGLSKLRFIFIFVPGFLLDFLYNMTARYRYKIFGRMRACKMDGHIKDRYIY